MSDDELSVEDLEILGAELRALLVEIDGVLSASAEGARPVELDQAAVGRVSRIDAIQQQSMVQANRRAQSVRRQQVQAALAALADGTYGDCRRCEEPIARGRLFARPESPFCLTCQSTTERG